MFADIAAAVQRGADTGVLFGLVFLICGLAFKVSAAPFHMWTPDVYEGAPTPVVAFFAAAPKLAAMVLFARLLAEGFGGAIAQWQQVLVALAPDLGRRSAPSPAWRRRTSSGCWAYSSIANIGYALIGLAAGTAEGVQAMLVFMVLYMVDVTGFFACLAALSREGRPMETLDDMAGLFARAAGHRAGHDRLVAVGAGPAAVLRLLGQVLCVQGGAGRRPVADRRVLGLVG